jgi:NAD(P)-dependent dehydrogenase (short-subunit alcohol dehydrogenase family)
VKPEPRNPNPGPRRTEGKLAGRIVAVTGANRGIGRAIVEAVARQGARVVLIGRDRRGLARAAREIGGNPIVAEADLTRRASVLRAFRDIRRKTKRLDALVNNAGVFIFKPFTRTTLKDWDRVIAANLTSLFVVTQAALPLLRRGRDAHLVNILSVSSRVAFEKCSAYTASKFGAMGLTRVLRKELRPMGIRVTAILPGSTHTRMADEFDFPVDREKLLQPDDVAEAVLTALLQPPRASVEEIHLMPSGGSV